MEDAGGRVEGEVLVGLDLRCKPASRLVPFDGEHVICDEERLARSRFCIMGCHSKRVVPEKVCPKISCSDFLSGLGVFVRSMTSLEASTSWGTALEAASGLML